MRVILHHEGLILGVPAAEMQGPGIYEVEDGHVIAFTPLAAVQTEIHAPDSVAAAEELAHEQTRRDD